MANNRPPMARRLRLAVIIIISQMLLIALAIAWLVHMTIIAVDGSVYFVENNHFILFIEITTSAMITLFGLWVLVLQLQRLGERRAGDRMGERRAGDRVGERRATDRREGSPADRRIPPAVN